VGFAKLGDLCAIVSPNAICWQLNTAFVLAIYNSEIKRFIAFTKRRQEVKCCTTGETRNSKNYKKNI
jgi:hypothetical protein